MHRGGNTTEAKIYLPQGAPYNITKAKHWRGWGGGGVGHAKYPASHSGNPLSGIQWCSEQYGKRFVVKSWLYITPCLHKDDSREQSLLVPMPGNSVFLQGSCFAFIWSSAYLSADHISLLAWTVRKLQIKMIAYLSQL